MLNIKFLLNFAKVRIYGSCFRIVNKTRENLMWIIKPDFFLLKKERTNNFFKYEIRGKYSC